MKQLAILLLLATALFAADAPAPTCVTPPANKLEILKYVPPEFPSGATTHGDVLLSGIVDETGHLKNLEVLQGHPFLSGPVIEAASQWIVQTYCVQGKPVNAVVLLSTSWQKHRSDTEIRVDADATKRLKKKHR